MKKSLRIGTMDDAGKRFIDTFNKLQRGEKVQPQDNVTFLSWSALASVMSDKRHELLKHLRKHPAESISALARELKRDYKRVHEDVSALETAGLIEKKGRLIKADYDEIRTVISV
jgi:predicted transcriptional regulator